MDLGAMTVSLRADLSGLDAGLRRAQELISRSAEELGRQEERFRRAGTAVQGLERRWSVAWEAMDAAADAAVSRIVRRFGRGVAQMIVDGRGLREFWRGLWRDLLEIAVQRLLQMVLRTRAAAGDMREALSAVGGGLFGGVGGVLGSLLGGVFGGIGDVFSKIGDWLGFDNPRHDAWARKQGFDFAKHFRAGVAAAMAAPFGALPPSLSPTLASAGIGSLRGGQFRAVSIQPGAFVVNITAAELNERVVRDAGGILADEVSRRLGWTDRRTGL